MEARKQSQDVSEKVNAEKNEKISKIKETFHNFREGFIAWKTIKETWKFIKNSGDEDSISQTKNY